VSKRTKRERLHAIIETPYVRLGLVITVLLLIGLAIILLATTSTATDNAQLVVNLVTVAIVVASSSVTVVLGGYVQGWVKGRNKAKLTKSLMVAYATRILEELPKVLSFFEFLSYTSWDEDSMRMMPLLTKNRTLDTSIYDPRIRDNLLFLKEKLANDVTYFDMLIRMINDSVEYCLTIITSSQPEALSKWSQLRKENLQNALRFVQRFTLISDQFRTALLKGKKDTGIDWSSLLKQSQVITTITSITPKSDFDGKG